MFLGTHNYKIDDKHRATVPSKFRLELGKTVVLTKGFDGCLEIRTQSDFQVYANKLLSIPTTKIESRTIVRQLLANAYELEIDSGNRILIPANMTKYGSLSKEIVYIGLGNKIELWDKQKYDIFNENSDTELEKLIGDIDNVQF